MPNKHWGPIHGVIHSAGKVRHAMQDIHQLAPSATQEHFHAKVHGTQVLARLVDERNVDFCLLMSSLSAVLGGLGFGAYAAANSYLDAFVQGRHSRGDLRWLSVNWDGWLFDETVTRTSDQHGVTPFEGVDAFEYLLRMPAAPQWVHSSHGLDQRMAKWLHMAAAPKARACLHARPNIVTAYVEPSTATERQLIAIWQDVLGIEQNRNARQLLRTGWRFRHLGASAQSHSRTGSCADHRGELVPVPGDRGAGQFHRYGTTTDKRGKHHQQAPQSSARAQRKRGRSGDRVMSRARSRSAFAFFLSSFQSRKKWWLHDI